MFGFRSRSGGNKGAGFAGGGFGMAMFLAGAAALGWNEIRTVKQAAAISEIAENAKTVQISQVDASNEGQAVYLIGRLASEAGARDDIFGVGDQDTLSVERSVEMYQWVRYKDDGKTKYKKQWDEDYNNNSSGYENPQFPVEAQNFVATDAQLGAFAFSAEQVSNIGGKASAPSELDESLRQQGWKSSDGKLFLGTGSSGSPEIGDVRVRFEVLTESELSVIARQQGDGLAPFVAKNGYDLFLAEQGKLTIPQLISSAESNNTGTAWMLRVAGSSGMTVGLGLAFSGWLALFAWIPFLGPLIQRMAFGTGAIIGGILAIILFSGAWLYAHPLVFIGIAALLCVLAIAFGMRARGAQPMAVPHNGPPMPPPQSFGPSMPPPPPR